MEDVGRKHEAWVGYRELDLVAIPADIPAIGVRLGETGLVRNLDLGRRGDVVATVEMIGATGLTKGWVEMAVRPSEKVLSYSPPG